MSAEETQVYEFLRKRDGKYVSVIDISKFLDSGRRFQQDRHWAHPILRRMEMDGILESNLYGEYRLKDAERESEPEREPEPEGEPRDFKEALRNPDASLGDTTIIRITDV